MLLGAHYLPCGAGTAPRRRPTSSWCSWWPRPPASTERVSELTVRLTLRRHTGRRQPGSRLASDRPPPRTHDAARRHGASAVPRLGPQARTRRRPGAGHGRCGRHRRARGLPGAAARAARRRDGHRQHRDRVSDREAARESAAANGASERVGPERRGRQAFLVAQADDRIVFPGVAHGDRRGDLRARDRRSCRRRPSRSPA